MSNGNSFGRLFKLQAMIGKMVLDGKRDPEKVADALQAIVSECLWELYLAPGQEHGGWVKGFDLEKHLKDKKLIDRAFSLEDKFIKGWIANPSSYPEELKNKAVFLWKSKRSSGDDVSVAGLYWRDGEVLVYWDWLECGWHGARPALLASS